MKTKHYLLVIVVCLAVSLGLNVVLGLRLNSLETQDQITRQNNEAIYLTDPKGLVASEAVFLGGQVSILGDIYRLESAPYLLSRTGESVPIDAHRGQTIHLMISSPEDGYDQIAYYICCTNSRYCTADIVKTGILVN